MDLLAVYKQFLKDNTNLERAKFFIRKAIGWILRDLSKINPKVVIEFLNENKSNMNKFSYQEGSRKLSVADKNRLV